MNKLLEEKVRSLTRENGRLQKTPRTKTHGSRGVPAWSLSSFLTSTSLISILADQLNKTRPPGRTEAQWAKGLREGEIELAVDASLPALKKELIHHLRKLKEQEHIDATEMNAKFLADGSAFEFKYGDLDTYHGGLEKLIGAPHLDLEQQMLREHSESDYASIQFSTHACASSLGAGKTFPMYEYNYVVHFSGTVENTDKGRNGYPLSYLLNDSAEVITKAGLQVAEVIALRLYTGPMYIWYNSILRYSQVALEDIPTWAPSFVHEWKKSGWRDVFTTTLHVLNSAIIKLSRTMAASKVFRGTKGGILPASFWKPNAMNVRGGIDIGFMSTTTKRDVAMRFAGADSDDGKPSMLFEIQMGMVDRGAPVRWCSQFPGEEEILFAPLCGLEVMGEPRVVGRALVVELRINCNLHDMTIEQVIGQRKALQLQTFRVLERELEHNPVARSVDEKISLAKFGTFVKSFEEKPPATFNDPEFMVNSLRQALELQGNILATSLHRCFHQNLEVGYENYFDRTGVYEKMKHIQFDKHPRSSLEDLVGQVSIANLSLSASGKPNWLAAVYREHRVEIKDEDLRTMRGHQENVAASVSPSGQFASICGQWTPANPEFTLPEGSAEPTIPELRRHPMCEAAALTDAELVALRLYFSEMFIVYEDCLWHNAADAFPVTIHLAEAAFRKLSSTSRERKTIYRGSNYSFPVKMLEKGFCWYEIGHFAAYANRAEALQYAMTNKKDEMTPAILFEIEGSNEDSWGIEYGWLASKKSKHGGNGVLLPALSLLAVTSVSVDVSNGAHPVAVIRVSATANTTTKTVEQLELVCKIQRVIQILETGEMPAAEAAEQVRQLLQLEYVNFF